MHDHITPRRTYIIVAAALLVLTALTVQAAFIDLGPWNNVVALGIAVTKAALVLLFFMQLRYSPGLTRLVVVVGIFFVALLIIGIMDDYATRTWIPIPGR
jgi:cytochrome c oxidase subunit 4